MTEPADLAPGFRMTEIGSLSEDWEIARIGDLFDMRQGKSLSPRGRLGLSPVPFLRTANVLWGRVDLTKVDQMDFSEREVEVYSLRPGDLLVCEGGDVGRTALWTGALDPCCYQNHLHRLRAKRDDVWPPFYAFWMQAALALLGLYVGTENRSTIPNLSQARLRVFAVPLPPLSEQRSIAAVLNTTRRAVEATEKVLAVARELKRSLLQYLFTHGPVPHGQADQVVLKETEIGPVPEAWDVVPVSSLAQSLRYGTSARCNDETGTPVLRIPNVVEGAIRTDGLKLLIPSIREAEKLRLQQGDLLFVRTNASRDRVGRCAVYHSELPDALFASYLIRARFDPARVMPEYVHYYTWSPRGRRFFYENATGAGDGKFNINTQTIRALPVPLPDLAVQREIVRTITAVDARARAAEARKVALQVLFNAMLRQLMVGQVRVNHLDLPIEEQT